MMRIALLGAALVGGLMSASMARAQDAAPSEASPAASAASPDDEEARGLFDAGERAFAGGNYERALEHFRRAYELSHRDALLYNIGVTADRLRRDAEALEAFEAYLASPALDAGLRPQVEARIAVLRRAVDEGEAEEDEAPPAPRDPTAAIAVVVVGGVLVAGAAVFFALGAVENDAVQSAPMGSAWSDYSGRLDAATGLVAAGAAATGLGIGLLVVGSLALTAPPPERGPVEVAVGPGSLVVRGTF